MVILAGVYIRYTWKNAEHETSISVLKIAKSIGVTLSGNSIQELKAEPGDINKSEYRGIKNHLKEIIRVNPEARFAYIYKIRDNRLYFAVDSEPENSKDYSPPGQEYTEATAEDKRPFIDGKDIIEEPSSDRWGTWISILIPLKDENGKTTAVFGMDFDANTWRNSILSDVIKAGIIVSGFFLLFIFSIQIAIKNRVLNNEITRSQKAEKVVQDIISKNPMSIHIVDKEGKTLVVNQAHTKLFGTIPPPEYTVFEDIHIKKQGLTNLIERVKNGEVVNFPEIFYNAHDSNPKLPDVPVWIRMVIFPLEDSKGKPERYVLMHENITERKLAEDELRKLSQAVEQSPASVVITNMNGDIEYANPRTTETTGYSLEELKGKNPRILSSGELPLEEYQRLWSTISTGKEWRGEFHNKKKNGQFYWESAVISPILDEKGNIIHYLAVKEDITEKKQTINELIQAKEKAETANQLKDAFIANMSHEIRTPLNGILGMSGLIREFYSKDEPDESEEFFISMERSSKRLTNAVDKILNFSRLQVGDYPVAESEVSLSSILQFLVYEYGPIAKAKSIEMIFNCETAEDSVLADESVLSIAFGNIIDNAIKFTDNGSVDIVIYRDEQNELCVEIRDTGIGISEEYQAGIFEPYSQEVVGYSRPYEGLGLGLAIAKKMFGLCRADINIKSKKNEGTVFGISFNSKEKIPYGDKTQERGEIKPQITRTITGRKPAVLVVEDDEVNQLFAEAILQKDFTVEVADDAEKAMELFLSRRLI